MYNLLTRILPLLLILFISACETYQYSPHPIHTRITQDHYRKLEQSVLKRERLKAEVQKHYRDNDAHYYLHQYNQRADNPYGYSNSYTNSPIIIQPPTPKPTPSPSRMTNNLPPKRNAGDSNQQSKESNNKQIPVPQDNDSNYYLTQPTQTTQDNPTVVTPYSNNQAPTIIVVPPPQVAAPVAPARPPYPVDNDSYYFMDYSTKPVAPSPNQPGNTNQDLELFFNDS